MTHRVAWLTDIHLNFVTRERAADLAERIRRLDVDSVLIGGDVGEANNFAEYLEKLVERIARPTYFVLGNHDYYRGSIANVRAHPQRGASADIGEPDRPDRSRGVWSAPGTTSPRTGMNDGEDVWDVWHPQMPNTANGAMIMAKPREPWNIRPAKKKARLTGSIKSEVEAKANDLIENVLKPKYVLPPEKTSSSTTSPTSRRSGTGIVFISLRPTPARARTPLRPRSNRSLHGWNP